MYRIAFQISAVFIILVGMITFPLPIPIGAVLMAVGISMLIGSSKTLQNLLQTSRRRNPRFHEMMRKVEQRAPRKIKNILEKTDPDQLQKTDADQLPEP
jgi:hypothetical protein